MTAHPGAGVDQEAVDAQLAKRSLRLRFAPALERRHEADTAARRRRELLLAASVSLVVFDLFLLNDLVTRPAVFGVAVACRGVATLYALLVLVLIARPTLPAHWRENLVASALPVTMAAAGVLAYASPQPARTFDPFLLNLVLMAGNTAFPLRFVQALWSTTLSLAITLTLVMAPDMDASARPWAAGLLVGTAAFSLIACWRIEHAARLSYLLRLREVLRLQVAQRSAENWAALSQTDALTGLPNRRAFDSALAMQGARGRAQGRSLALMLIDADHFKRFNDHHGHLAGDDCLRTLAQAMRGALRENDLLARYGGEEFVALLPGASPRQACATAERVRAAVQAAAVARGDGASAVVTVSVGVAVSPDGSTVDLLSEADTALYAAKAAGRNRWMLAGRNARPADSAFSESGFFRQP